MVSNIIPNTMLLLFSFLLVTIGANPCYLVNEACQKSSIGDPNINYTFCVKAFESTPSSRHANLTRLGLISINLVKRNATSTTSSIKSLLNGRNKDVDNSTKEGLKDSLELYSNSISTLYEAARAYRAKRLDEANVKVSSVMDASSTCEQGFQDFGVVSPLSKQNNDTFQLSAISLSIMDRFNNN